MSRFIGTMLAAALVAGATSPLRADDKDVTAILDKAIKALGGEEKLAKSQTFTQTAKGTITIMDNDSEVTSNMWVQGLDHARQEFTGNFGGNMVKGVTVLAGDKGWRKFGDDKMPLEGTPWPTRSAASTWLSSRSRCSPSRGRASRCRRPARRRWETRPR
jgi:hypothetical protein